MSEEIAASLRFISPASAEEIAAVTAVLQGAVDELAESNSVATPVSAWNRSQRSVRGTLTPGQGAWRGFSG